MLLCLGVCVWLHRYLWFELNMHVVVEPQVGSEIESMPELRFVETFTKEDMQYLNEYVDFVVCLGGDGVVLHASNLYRDVWIVFFKCIPNLTTLTRHTV